MHKILSKAKFVYQYIISSIGFYPTLISTIFFGLAVVVLYMERHGLSEQLLDTMFSFMIISHGETAGLILSSITTGIISLTVFSFTMVMLVLNQASANFTPRVIPGLISHKSNQSVMGLYLGTLIYTLVIMVNIRSDSYSESLPGFAIFLGMCFAIICLGFFVYFIHAISQSIQIGNILQEIYKMTHESLSEEIEEDTQITAPDAFKNATWYELKSPRTGYLQSIDRSAVLRVCREYDIILDFELPLGNFLVEGIPFARIDKRPENNDELLDSLLSHVNFYREERPDLNYLFGIKHITESAVKALSPSVNDPGTAIKAMEYLVALLALRMQLTDEKIISDKDGIARIRFRQETFENLLKQSLGPIRVHGKDDPEVHIQLLITIKILAYKATDNPAHMQLIRDEAGLILDDADVEIKNRGDRNRINLAVKQANEIGKLKPPLPLLSEHS